MGRASEAVRAGVDAEFRSKSRYSLSKGFRTQGSGASVVAEEPTLGFAFQLCLLVLTVSLDEFYAQGGEMNSSDSIDAAAVGLQSFKALSTYPRNPLALTVQNPFVGVEVRPLQPAQFAAA